MCKLAKVKVNELDVKKYDQWIMLLNSTIHANLTLPWIIAVVLELIIHNFRFNKCCMVVEQCFFLKRQIDFCKARNFGFLFVINQKNVFSKKNETKWSLNPHDFYGKGFKCATLRS
jgi:hypothetical protein